MAADHSRSMRHLALRLLRRLKDAHVAQTELWERTMLRQEPWREELLHWSFDGATWQLHGSVLPASGGSRRSVTRGGWCPRSGARVPGPPRPSPLDT
ncbi:hypothetical protein [Nocardioides sp. CER19]|uniref:hypothetical protein n=1 Tax=Nocardioides sp. CER19 TaxID=3038538 RepID=UPI002446ACBF|nr:hypothetical protein [Nocardioides sp. CER19]MDH2413252.1 hypothetical protein [Nocardioides sp. CER19]